MMPIEKLEWLDWLDANSKLRNDAPAEIKKQYKQYQKEHKEWKEKWTK